MKRNNSNTAAQIIFILLGLLAVIALALRIAPFVGGGFAGLWQAVAEMQTAPLALRLCENSARTVFLFVLLYAVAVAALCSGEHNYRRREEHGSAKWGNAKQLCRKYRDKDFCQNRLLTEHVRIGPDGRKHRRNLNTLVVGGSGSGKTRFYAKPNAMNANISFVLPDPKGETIRSVAPVLLAKGYDIKVLDLLNMEKSFCYNPFVYLKSDNDIQRLATNIFKNTAPQGKPAQDPFWDNAANMLLLALMFYLHYEAPEDEQNFPMIMEMLRAAEVSEDDEDYRSPLDELFDRLEARDPYHIAVKYYRSYRSGSAKTLKSIQITLMSRLEKFNLPALTAITQTDETELWTLGERKTAIFAIIPDNDTSFNFIVGMLYTQLFQQLYYQADFVHAGRLPMPVHFIMDEFPNVALPDDFDKLLATMRSREISVSIIVQNMAQLKALYEKQWESIVGNCDEFLYLGGNELSTHEYVSKLLGRETIDTNSYGRSRGRSESYSTNYQIAGRELMTPDEVRRLDNRDALVFIRGERPVMDRKFNLEKHPNFRLSADGGAKPYRHGEDTHSIAALWVYRDSTPQAEAEVGEHNIVILFSEELEEKFKQREEPT